MRQITLGSTGITSPQNAFGALPIQRRDKADAVKLLRRAYEGGMTYFDTAPIPTAKKSWARRSAKRGSGTKYTSPRKPPQSLRNSSKATWKSPLRT